MKSKNIHTAQKNKWLSIALTGLGLAVSFPPFPFPFVSCVALIPLLRRWYHATDSREIYLEFFYAFLILFTITFSWPLKHPFTNTAIASLSGILLIPMSLALPFSLSRTVKLYLGRGWGLLACGAFFLVMESIWTHGPIAMPGTLLGHTFSNQIYINQIVDITGVAGLTLLILAFNITGMLLLEKTSGYNQKMLWSLLGLLALLPLFYSIWSLHGSQLKPADDNLEISVVSMVQPAKPALTWSDEQDQQRVTHLQHLTDSLIAANQVNPDLVLWPETAIPVQESLDDSLVTRLQRWVDQSGFSLLSGAILENEVSGNPARYSNSAILFKQQTRPQQYNKNWLVPFAEHVPFEQELDGLSFLRVDAGGVSGYTPGTKQPLLTLNDTSFGVLICFESLFGHFAREYAAHGASFIVALSNIGWWGSSIAPAQYLAFSRLRAIESRRSLLINTVTGPALVVDPFGRTTAQMDWMESGMLTVKINHGYGQTMYARLGDWLSLLAIIVSMVILVKYVLVVNYSKRA